jgi:hypothetical protein
VVVDPCNFRPATLRWFRSVIRCHQFHQLARVRDVRSSRYRVAPAHHRYRASPRSTSSLRSSRSGKRGAQVDAKDVDSADIGVLGHVVPCLTMRMSGSTFANDFTKRM